DPAPGRRSAAASGDCAVRGWPRRGQTLMLTSAETDLVRRDPALPGLATVLDPEAFLATLRRAAPALDLRGVQITYATYSPRAFCRAMCLVDVAGAECAVIAHACRAEDFPPSWLDGEARSGMAGPLGSRHVLLDESAVFLTVFPNDFRLTQLEDLYCPD